MSYAKGVYDFIHTHGTTIIACFTAAHQLYQYFTDQSYHDHQSGGGHHREGPWYHGEGSGHQDWPRPGGASRTPDGPTAPDNGRATGTRGSSSKGNRSGSNDKGSNKADETTTREFLAPDDIDYPDLDGMRNLEASSEGSRAKSLQKKSLDHCAICDETLTDPNRRVLTLIDCLCKFHRSCLESVGGWIKICPNCDGDLSPAMCMGSN